MAVDCIFSKKLKICGFDISSQGFYSIDIPEARVKANQATCFITVLVGEANEEKIDKELKNLVRGIGISVRKSHAGVPGGIS
jgi:hypothetical protein